MSHRQEDSPQDPTRWQSNRAFVWIAQHPTIVSSLVISILIVQRVAGAADYDTATALALLTAGGTASVVFAAFISILPHLLGPLAIVGAFFLAGSVRDSIKRGFEAWGIPALAALILLIGLAAIALDVVFLLMVGIAVLVGLVFRNAETRMVYVRVYAVIALLMALP